MKRMKINKEERNRKENTIWHKDKIFKLLKIKDFRAKFFQHKGIILIAITLNKFAFKTKRIITIYP